MAAGAQDVRRGLTYAFAGFGMLSCGDAVIKSISGEWPGTAVAAVRYLLGTLVLAAILFARNGRAGFVCPKPGLQLARGASVAFATIFFFLGIFAMPLTDATVIQFVNPMLVALLAIPLLGERAPRAAWIATAIAFLGVLVVLRPEISRIGLAGLFPAMAAFGMALTVIFNRKAAGLGSALQMQFLISLFATPIIVLATIIGHFAGPASLHLSIPDWSVVVRCAMVACSASLAHGLIYMATERASAPAISPAVYIQLLVALILGAAIFGDMPDLAALAGACLIVSAGLYLWRTAAR